MKKTLSLLLSVVILTVSVFLMPYSSYAAENGTVEITDSFARWDVNSDEKSVFLYSTDGEYTDSYKGISYDEENNTLSLSAVSSKKNAFSLILKDMGDININLTGNSSLVEIVAENTNINFSGKGKLFINPAYSWTGENIKHSKEHISDCPLRLKNGAVFVENTANIKIETKKNSEYCGEFLFETEQENDNIFFYEGKVSAKLKWDKTENEDGYVYYLKNTALSFISTAVPVPSKKTEEKISLDSAKVTGVKNKTYTGKPVTLKLTVTLNEKTLTRGVDYTVAYSTNMHVGTATVSIIGKGDYTGKITKHFKVIPKPTKIKKLKPIKGGVVVFISRKRKQITGYEVQCSRTKTFKKSKKGRVPNKGIKLKAIKGLRGRKKYYIRVRTYTKVGKKFYYSKWSKPKSVKTKKR